MITTKQMRTEKVERLLKTYRAWTDAKFLELKESIKIHGSPLAKKAYDIITKERNLKA